MRPRQTLERCELCGADLAAEHPHLVEPANRRIVCACDACAILFDSQEEGRYRRMSRTVEFLRDFRMTDEQWDDLHIPINLAFFFRGGSSGKVAAFYPSPAGAMESLLPLETWQVLERENPVLRELRPDVEALLVNRIGASREFFRVPIDVCYHLVGLIRRHWRGLSGGTEVWAQIARFFTLLKDKCPGNREP
jgi:hypothetical protein